MVTPNVRSGGRFPFRGPTVDPPDDLRGEPERGREAEIAAFTRPSHAAGEPGHPSLREPPRGCRRLPRQPERPGQHARPAAGNEAHRQVGPNTVQDLVEATVAGEDEERVRLGAGRQLSRVPGPLGPDDLDVAEHARYCRHRLGRHPARLWVDDQEPRATRTMPAHKEEGRRLPALSFARSGSSIGTDSVDVLREDLELRRATNERVLPAGTLESQSVGAIGSASCSPWKRGPPCTGSS